jgi:hypothetical protein
MRRSLLLLPFLAGCPRVYRVTEGVTETSAHRVGGELTITAGRYLRNGDHAGIAAGLRAGVMVDGAGATAIVGITIDAVYLPPRRPGGFSEDTEQMWDPPHGPAARVGVHLGSTAGGELALMWSRGRLHPDWLIVGAERRDSRYRSLGLEIGGEHAIGGVSWGALRLVEEWDRLVKIQPGPN